MRTWAELSIAEQTLIRAAIAEQSLAGTIQSYGIALRWAGAPDAPPPRSYTEAEQCVLVPKFAAVTLQLHQDALLRVHQAPGLSTGLGDVLTGGHLHQVLNDPATWLWSPSPTSDLRPSAPRPVREHWFTDAYPTANTGDLPGWDHLSIAQQKVLVCAAEASGMLTGAFGIWPDPPAQLNPARRLAWVDQQLAPLLPFVRDGLIEVRHLPDTHSDAFTVISDQDLRTALADPVIRYQGDECGIGVTCVFTFAGAAIWRGGWSSTWASRLAFGQQH